MRLHPYCAVTLVVAALGVASARNSQAQAPVTGGVQGPPQVLTTASGEARLTPDRAAVFVGVQTRGATAAVAGRDNAQRQRAIIDTVLALGIPREQISTENYSVFPETRYDRDTQKPTGTGYVVNNVVRVEVRRTEQVGSVIDAALAKGANQINSLEFFSSNTDAARRQALADAIAKARGDAEAMARAAGGSLGPVLELTTFESGPRPLARADLAMARTAQAAPTPVEPGELTLHVTVSARWQFVPAR